MSASRIQKAVVAMVLLTMTAGAAMAQGVPSVFYDRGGPQQNQRGPDHRNVKDNRAQDSRGGKEYRAPAAKNHRGPVKFDAGTRASINRYYAGYYKTAKSCPRGYKFRQNVCRPTGWTKQRYTIGKPLPRSVVMRPIPTNLYRQLPPAPSGHAYRFVDGDLLLIAAGKNIVVDAIIAMNVSRR